MYSKPLDLYFVRIVILNYNESHYTVSLINQLQNQTFKNFEIIVVDNSSNNKEVQLLQNNLPKDVIAIYSEKNLGYAAGNNLGLRYTANHKIDYHLVLNNDLIIEDLQMIEKMLIGVIGNKEKNVVASSPLINTISSGIELKKQMQVRKLLSKWDTFLINIPIFKFYTNHKLAGEFLYRSCMPFTDKVTICDTINGAAFMIEHDFLHTIGYLDEGTFLYYEEIILGKQIKNQGKTCLLNGHTSVKHLQGISTKNSAQKLNIKMERIKYMSSLYYLRKYEKINVFEAFLYKILSELVILVKRKM